MRRFLIAFALCFVSTSAIACPDYRLWGREVYEVSARELYTPREAFVVAGGDQNLSYCNLRARNWSGPMPGWVISEPDFTVTVYGLSGYQLEFRVESQCDTVMLINTAAANWYYDDDDNGYGDPKIRLTRPAGDGIYDIWIGTYDGGNCDARLIMETF